MREFEGLFLENEASTLFVSRSLRFQSPTNNAVATDTIHRVGIPTRRVAIERIRYYDIITAATMLL